jgi:hypothetical protein
MKLKYLVRYKIKRDYPETDLEGEFNIYAYGSNDVIYEALRKMKEEFPEIIKVYTNSELLNFMSFYYEYPVHECYICGEIFDMNNLDFYEIIFTKLTESKTEKMTFCKNCFFSLTDEIHFRRYNKLNSKNKNE